MKFMKGLQAAVLGLAVLAAPAHATLFINPAVVSSPNVITFDDYFEFVTAGPENVGASIGQNVIMEATTPSTLGASIAELGSNGTWAAFVDPGSPFAAIGSAGSSSFGAMTFNFASGPVAAVGAFMNYFRPAPGVGQIVIVALGAANVMLESYVLNIATAADSFNAGRFFGIARGSIDILGFTVFGNGFVLDDLRFSTLAAPVPEPSEWMMFLAGLLLVGFIAKRRSGLI